MALFKRSRSKADSGYVALPLVLPVDDNLLYLPDPELLRDHAKAILELANTAGETAVATDRSVGFDLASELTRIWAVESANPAAALDFISFCVRLGYAFSAIEISNPVSLNDGFMHPLIDAAMDYAATQVPAGLDEAMRDAVPFPEKTRYAIRAGHYAGRSGFAAIPTLIARALPPID